MVNPIDALLKVEGGYADDPTDRGGETMAGVTRRNWPHWPGWDIVDAMKASGQTPVVNDAMYVHLHDFYRLHYWTPVRASDMPPALGADVFDMAVNLGVGRAVEILQASLNLLNRNEESWQELLVDGRIGPVTLGVLKTVLRERHGERNVLKVNNALQGEYYIKIARRQPTQERFLRGWLDRA